MLTAIFILYGFVFFYTYLFIVFFICILLTNYYYYCVIDFIYLSLYLFKIRFIVCFQELSFSSFISPSLIQDGCNDWKNQIVKLVGMAQDCLDCSHKACYRPSNISVVLV
eukprot:GHVR01069833.1.p1 GENE.GHVR01069833.1~~GHVR01069833.1.p1  ORF type:complete len:110 (+),score=0.57 GHVR01069833.1:1495-1824(+)